jgi:hypothetical protein
LKKSQTEYEKTLEKSTVKLRQEYQQGKVRLAELDVVFRRLYEDRIFEKISEAQFVAMTTGYDEERETLTARIAEIERILEQSSKQKSNATAFVKIVENYESINELSFELLHEYVDKIYVHEVDKEECIRNIEIVYNYIGNADIGGEKPQNESYFRQGVGNGACTIRSIVI